MLKKILIFALPKSQHMKSKICVVGCALAALSTLYFINLEAYTATAVSRIAFKLLLFVCFFNHKAIQNKLLFYAFFGTLLITDLCSIGAIYISASFLYAISGLFGLGYLFLLADGYTKFKVLNLRNTVAMYYFFVIAINALLMLLHLYNLYHYLEGLSWVYVGQVLYSILMFLMIIMALAYYLNSYSKKSMYFLIGTLAFIGSDILISAYYFYNIEENLVFLHTLLGMIGYVFFFNYFFTPEVPQLIEQEILDELRSRKSKMRD